MKLIKQIREERELLHKMMEAFMEERASVDADLAAKAFACLYDCSVACSLRLVGIAAMLAYAIIGILVLIVKLFRR